MVMSSISRWRKGLIGEAGSRSFIGWLPGLRSRDALFASDVAQAAPAERSPISTQPQPSRAAGSFVGQCRTWQKRPVEPRPPQVGDSAQRGRCSPSSAPLQANIVFRRKPTRFDPRRLQTKQYRAPTSRRSPSPSGDTCGIRRRKVRATRTLHSTVAAKGACMLNAAGKEDVFWQTNMRRGSFRISHTKPRSVDKSAIGAAIESVGSISTDLRSSQYVPASPLVARASARGSQTAPHTWR